MELIEKIFRVTNAEGQPIDLSEEKDIAVIINGKDNGIKLEHVFRKYALDEDEGTIYGTSLLAYFTPKDGKLVDAEGHTIEFLTTERKPILVTDNLEEPFLDDDADIDFDYVKAFSELVGINKPDELFAELLSDSEKEVFASERNKREADSKQKADADAQLKADAEAKKKADTDAKQKEDEETIKKQADADARAKVDPDYLIEEPRYKQHQKFYGELGFKEYAGDNVHLFYGKKWKDYNEDPFVLVKRGDNWWEDVETDVDNIVEDEKTVQLEFIDGEERKKLTLDLENGKISVEGAEKE